MIPCSDPAVTATTLVVAHYHWRAGGVRRVIERGLQALMASPCWERVERIRLLGGEMPPADWLDALQKQLDVTRPGLPVETAVCREMSYASDLGRRPDAGELRRFFRNQIPAEAIVWLHNAALARNVASVRTLAAVCSERQSTLLSHHHDFWCDNRWGRWAEARLHGVRSPAELAAAVFPVQPGVLHLTINRADFHLLEGVLGDRVRWLPNSFDPMPSPSDRDLTHARRWLREVAAKFEPGTRSGRVWLLPCRWLRRKNVLEALLLSQLLDKEAVLVTSRWPSSKDEEPYLRRVEAAARKNGWPLRLVGFEQPGVPPFDHLMAAADVLALTSLQEGFGLAFLEASAAGRPLVCRQLPAIQPDLDSFGFSFPHSYDELRIESGLAGGRREVQRQELLWQAWRETLPRPLRWWAEAPPVMLQPEAEEWPFSRLTLTGQLEVLRAFLPVEGAKRSAWEAPPWPEGARVLQGAAYAKTLAGAANSAGAAMAGKSARGKNAQSSMEGPAASVALQEALVRDRLRSGNLYPLLFSPKS